MQRWLIVLGMLLVLFAGCVSITPPVQELAHAQGTYLAAKAAGANATPSANCYLEKSQNELAYAKKAFGYRQFLTAYDSAVRAEFDAKLATALAYEASAQRVANEQQQEARSLKQQLQTQMQPVR